MSIKLLSSETINKIAAGEVIVRPLSVVKELVENSIDAGATKVDIKIERGGRNLIVVEDNGCGIKKEDIALAFQKHATSKLDENKIDYIEYLGFRGEALPSIASVAKTKIVTSTIEDSNSWGISIVEKSIDDSFIQPFPKRVGTFIEVRDLFFFTPSRLKFLKSEGVETAACSELVNKLALSRPNIAFSFTSNSKNILRVQKRESYDFSARIKDVMGELFFKNSVDFCLEKQGIKVWGRASIPTFNSSTSLSQYFFVNGRTVKDKVLSNAVRITYSNLIPNNRFPSIVLYISIDSDMVDVNVHPTKSEIRFVDSNFVKSVIVNAVRSSITADLRSSSEISSKTLDYISPTKVEAFLYEKKSQNYKRKTEDIESLLTEHDKNLQEIKKISAKEECVLNEDSTLQEGLRVHEDRKISGKAYREFENYPLGFAKCQIYKKYIISESKDGLVLIDQHAAHERLTLEKLKLQLKNNEISAQILLVPEVIELDNVAVENILSKKNELNAFGLGVFKNGHKQILIKKVPTILNKLNIKDFVASIAENIHLFDSIDIINEKIEEIWGTIACYSSVRSGRELKLDEMNALLRDIENTPEAAQCNHGRPTFVKLKLRDIEKIFERIK